MKLSPIKLQIRLKRVMILTIAWIIAGIFFNIIEYLLIYPASQIKDIRSLTSEVHISSYDFGRSLVVTIIASIIAGLSIGSFEIFYFQNRFRKKSFSYTVFIKSLVYSFTMIVLIIVGLILDQSFGEGKSLFHKDVLQGVSVYLSGSGVWAFVIHWTVVIILTQIFIQVSDSFGYGVMHNFILGKYNTPKEESRIFMFIDLKSSTTIAERLGHIKYHNLLNDFFDDLNDSIIFSKGEIYQYIGDEVTVSWTMKNGIDNENCLRCFFSIVDEIKKKSESYLKKYELIPEFKASLHCGSVTIGEVGVIKKEIVFTGDVLNTASRIQEMCNVYNVNLLVSESLINSLKNENRYSIEAVGELTLRGKQTTNILYNLKEIN